MTAQPIARPVRIPAARDGHLRLQAGSAVRTAARTAALASAPTAAPAQARTATPLVPRVPNLLLAGVTHADASVLARDLGSHPDVCPASTRRIDHFTPLRYGRPVRAALQDYDAHFAAWRGQAYRLESSPVYFDGGPALVEAVRASCPGTQVVLVLRDPAERLWTSYADKVARGRLPGAMTFDTFVDRCLALRANGADGYEGNRYFRTLSSGFYAEHLRLWLAAFGSRAHVVFAEHLTDDRPAATAALLTRLGLDASRVAVAPDAVAAADGAPAPASARSWRNTLRRLTGREAGAARPDGVVRPTERQLARVAALYAEADGELAALLRESGCTDLPGWLGGR